MGLGVRGGPWHMPRSAGARQAARPGGADRCLTCRAAAAVRVGNVPTPPGARTALAKARAAATAIWWEQLGVYVKRFPTLAAAFRAGYRLGYYRAYRSWRRRDRVLGEKDKAA